MESIVSDPTEVEIPKTETCEVFEAGGGICEMVCPEDDDHDSEKYDLAKNSDSVESVNVEPHESGESEVIANVPVVSDAEVAPISCPADTEPSEKSEIVESVEAEAEPVNIEKPPFIDFNELAKKTPAPSNKRKSDNHNDSSIEEKKCYNMRKNIRGVINENFDTITIAAQREESERLARVQSLKKSVKQSFLTTGLEAMDEDIPYDVDLLNDESMASSETMEPQAVACSQLRRQLFDLKENKLQRVAERRFDKKLWSQWLSAERSSAAAEEKGEVVTIDSSSDDDCIILSDSDDGADDDPEDDHHNSGLHVRDVLNIPNEHGKVLVNVGHVENEPDIYVAPQIAKVIKPHQIGGVRFLFDNIIESTKRFNNSSGFGCILAHSMGLGKTLQVVCFSDIFLRHTESKTILCVMPINTIQNWVKEFNLWLPEESDDHEKVRPRQFAVYALNDQHKTLSSRSNVILKWAAKGGVLLIGYELFRVLGMKIIKKKDIKKSHESAEHKRLLDQIQMALVKPGPDLVICDEGHRIKNAHAGISIALKQIRSRRRIVLTGYPLQNNLLEYWCMVDFVRPNYLGSKTEFCNMFERPIQNGQCIDSTPGDIKLMRYRAHVLHSLLVGFVQRRSDSVLQNSLPQKMEYVILTKMTKLQRELYDAFMNEVVRKKKVPNPLKAFAVCCKIWNHPDVLYNFLKKRESDYDLDIDEEATVKSNLESGKAAKVKAETAQLMGEADVPHLKDPDSESLFANDQKPFSENPNPNAFWQDSMSSSQPPKPDYVGLMAKPPQTSATNGETAKCSSQIVDLDTKEVQFIKSDIPTNLEVNSLSSAGNVKPAVKIDAEFQGGNGHIKALKNDVKPGTESISYDWALNIMKNYEPGIGSNSPKMEIFMYILEESIKMGDRVLVFSQSLLTLNLMEYFLQSTTIPETETHWKKNTSYFRLDGSTSSLEREKLVNEFNANTDVKLFLISTRAGSLGINLTGANRVVVFDASWNPCHDTQAVHRIYRYGQRKCCFVYRIVMDNCMEKNIYDRQVKKQGMSDRVVDECNPDAHLSIRELTNLCYDKIDEEPNVEFKQPLESYSDVVMRKIITNHKDILSKEPFYHESLLIDRKDKKLSQTEKKLAKRGYEIEKKASSKPTFLPNNFEYKIIQNRDGVINKGVTQIHQFKKQVREPIKGAPIKLTRWIPAEVWQRQGMSSQEMMLPIDVAIPTNSSETSNIVVKAGEKVMVLNSPKGVYMQLESGKIIAIKTSVEALNKDNLKARKLNCPELFGKRPLPIDPKIFREDRGHAAAKPPCPDDDKDDVIVINDSINDAPSVSSIDLPFSKQKTRKDLIPVKRCIIPQLHMRHKSHLASAKQEAFNVRTHREFVKPPQTESSARPNFPEKNSRTPREYGQAAPSHLSQQRNSYTEKSFRANPEFVQPSLIETSPNPHYVEKDLRTHQEFAQPVLAESPPRSHYVEKSIRTHPEFPQPPLTESLPRTSNYSEKIPRPHQEFPPQSFPSETAVPANYSSKNLRPHHEYSHPAASEPIPRTNYVDKNLRTHQEFQPPIPTEPGTSFLDKNMRPLQEFPHAVPLIEHSPRNNYLEKSLRTHQEFEPPHQIEPPSPVTDYGEKDRNNMYGNVLHNPNYEIPPAHNLESQHLPPMPSRWENKSPEMYKQAVKISNIPAPYPSTSICDLSAFEKNEKPQEADIINVDQYNPSYAQPPSKDSDDHAFHHNMNLGSNYYNNPLSTNPTTTEDNGSLNTLYNYNNKNESNYSENLYENTDPSAHANYHQDMSKYSYGYYQPQYLPNFNNKAYDSNAFSSHSTQYYMRRPTTYSTSSANGVDVGLNYTEPQGWTKKHLPD